VNPIPAMPLDSANEKEATDSTNITADRMDAVKRDKLVKFQGNVIVTQKDFTMYSDELFVYYSGEQDIKEIVAVGNVKIIQPNRTAKSGRAVYKRPEKTLILTDNPIVQQGMDTISGVRIIFYLDQGKSVVEGSEEQRVNAVIYPKEANSRDKSQERE
jgi:lipopolysaccharide export system protein LptA